jgi:hypothetical protein
MENEKHKDIHTFQPDGQITHPSRKLGKRLTFFPFFIIKSQTDRCLSVASSSSTSSMSLQSIATQLRQRDRVESEQFADLIYNCDAHIHTIMSHAHA